MRYWEDITVGDVTELGKVEVTEEEIVAFARALSTRSRSTSTRRRRRTGRSAA